MTTIAILPVEGEDNQTTFSAVTTKHKATGRTVGEALDALTAQLSAEEAAAPVIIQQFRPDQFFSVEQRDRLSTLMSHWRAAREMGDALPPEEQAELEKLVDEEAQGSAERATHILRDLKLTVLLRGSYTEKSPTRHEQKSQSTWLGGLAIYMAACLSVAAVPLLISLIFRDYDSAGLRTIGAALGFVIGLIFFIYIWRMETKRADDIDQQSAESERRKAR
jgi:hypothetical protein